MAPSLRTAALHLLLSLALFLCVAPPALAEKIPKLVLSGPLATVSFPLIHMAESGALAELAESIEFVPWRDPDQLRLMTLDNKAQVLAMPTNVAANLYNRGVNLRLANVSVWGILWLVSRNPNAKTLADFKGEEIAMPFRGDMPDILFGATARAQELNPRSDFKLRYVASPMDAVQLLISRRVDHALLAEPAVSMALRKSKSFPVSVVAPDLYRSVDLQQEWGRVLHRSPRVPQAGITVIGESGSDVAFVATINDAYRASMQWCQQNAAECGRMVASKIDLLDAGAATDAISVNPLDVVAGAEARSDLEYFFETLMKDNPAIIGGRLPDSAFYGTGGQ